MSNHDLMSIARVSNFQDRIKYALQQSALDVMAEDNATVGHVLRTAFASKVLAGQVDMFQVSIAVLNNATIAQGAIITDTAGAHFGVDDSVLPFTVNSIFNAFAGVIK